MARRVLKSCVSWSGALQVSSARSFHPSRVHRSPRDFFCPRHGAARHTTDIFRHALARALSPERRIAHSQHALALAALKRSRHAPAHRTECSGQHQQFIAAEVATQEGRRGEAGADGCRDGGENCNCCCEHCGMKNLSGAMIASLAGRRCADAGNPGFSAAGPAQHMQRVAARDVGQQPVELRDDRRRPGCSCRATAPAGRDSRRRRSSGPACWACGGSA